MWKINFLVSVKKINPMPEEGSFKKKSLSSFLYPSLKILGSLMSWSWKFSSYSSSSEDVEASSKSLSTLSFSKFSSSELVPSDSIGWKLSKFQLYYKPKITIISPTFFLKISAKTIRRAERPANPNISVRTTIRKIWRKLGLWCHRLWFERLQTLKL